MSGYQFTISLRTSHPSIDPGRITEVLGREPAHSGRAGMPRTDPKGRPLTGTYPDSFWISDDLREGGWTPDAPSADLPHAIEDLLSDLAKHKDFLHELRSGGGQAEFFIGWFFDRGSGDMFRYDLLRKLADLQIDLSLCVYPPPDRAAPAPPEQSDASSE